MTEDQRRMRIATSIARHQLTDRFHLACPDVIVGTVRREVRIAGAMALGSGAGDRGEVIATRGRWGRARSGLCGGLRGGAPATPNQSAKAAREYRRASARTALIHRRASARTALTHRRASARTALTHRRASARTALTHR